MSDPIPQLPDVVLNALSPVTRRLVLNRRGSTVWEVANGRGKFAVKLGWPIEAGPGWDAQPWTALAPAREGAVLDRLGVEHVTYGEWEHGTWNIQLWREGPDLYRIWEHCRTDGSSVQPNVALGCAKALAELHARGWAHGDVQPAHFIIGLERTHLIDLALAFGGPVPERHDFPFRGCLVHYEAPEISRSVLETGTATPTQASDVYALGAALFISATGWRHVEYPDDAPRAEQRQAIVDKPHRHINVPGALGALIEHMMSRDPADRPRAADVVRQLRDAN
ncbi:protein kinase [Streptomyces sp. B-S-A8]|uniref:non-specific serine/threonine protein kinase n=1 Tax=Streptomyces solicavernae TaxID=3043614 RepID=A0ABT6S213_9ACTN|nr:protein kinase [Streptomyces sp. B-S-A8]MDI3390726.1 protein kinase [Streptomyces sp. B-S-A8]